MFQKSFSYFSRPIFEAVSLDFLFFSELAQPVNYYQVVLPLAFNDPPSIIYKAADFATYVRQIRHIEAPLLRHYCRCGLHTDDKDKEDALYPATRSLTELIHRPFVGSTHVPWTRLLRLSRFKKRVLGLGWVNA